MATFLALVQDVARESGTEPNIGDPSTLTGVTGRQLRMKHMVEDAWREIQRAHRNWLWMHATFNGTTIPGTREYDATAMGLTAARFSRWLVLDEQGYQCFTYYPTAGGQSQEAPLTYCEWPEFYRQFLRGQEATRTGPPRWFSVDPQRKLQLHPIPDASYTVRGRYYKAPQVLVADADEPECPPEHHDAIKWLALTQLAIFDENREQLGPWSRKYADELDDLRDNQLPPVRIEGPLA